VEELAAAKEREATVAVFDVPSAPAAAQPRAGTERAGARPELLILEIFAQRAKISRASCSRGGAQLEHLATRLVRGWTPWSASAAAWQDPAARARSRSSSTAA